MNQRWEEIEAASMVAISDERGSFEFMDLPEGFEDAPSVLWVTHTHHLPELVHVVVGDGRPCLPPVVELAPGTPISVGVVDPEGAPVVGALVEQTTPIPTSALADSWDPEARRVLQRSVVTDDRGRASAAAWDGPVVLRAVLGKLSSEPWIAEPRPEVELTVFPAFEVHGEVIRESGAEVEGEQRIVCQLVKGGQLRRLAMAGVQNGRWGPVALPVIPGDGYRFRIEGWTAEIQERAIAPPEPGSTVRVDFALRAGHEVWAFAHDGNRVPIPGASATVSWDQGETRVEAKSYQLEDGYISVRGIPEGAIDIVCEAPGYAPRNTGPLHVPEDPPSVHFIQLSPGRPVQGRVLSHEQPVTDFEVSSWTGGNAPRASCFRERSDGSFVLEAVSTHEVRLMATASGIGVSEMVTIPAGKEAPDPLTIELHDFVRGFGRVVDAATGEPVQEARVQTFVTQENRAITPWGASWGVGIDGRFDRSAFSVGRARSRFSAPGYSFHWAETFAQPGEAIDFGLIALTARKDLTVQLAAGEGFDYTAFSLSGHGAEPIGDRPFGPAGRLVIEQVSAGEYTLVISDRMGTWFEVPLVLHPDDDWLISVPVAGPHTLRVSLSPDAAAAEAAYLLVTLPDPGKRPTLFVREPLDGRTTEVSCQHAGEFRAALYGPDDRLLGTANGFIGEEDGTIEVVIDLAETSQRFRVVDSSGEPLPNVRLGVWSEDEKLRGGGADTDQDGECSLAAFLPGRYRAQMIHPELGYHLGVPVDVPRLSPEPIEIVFAADRAVEVRLLDGAEPLPAVHCRLFEERTGFDLSSSTSNAEGLVTWRPLGVGRFLLKVSQPGLWPTEAVVDARPPGEASEVQVRRLGDLEVALRTTGGGTAGRARIELESVEFSTSVGEWIGEDRVVSSTGGLDADAEGRLVLTGLPRGTYRWAADDAGGAVDVLPASRARLDVVLP